MRRLAVMGFIGLLFLVSAVGLAQDDEPVATPDDTTTTQTQPTAQPDILQRAEDLTRRAEDAATRAQDAADRALESAARVTELEDSIQDTLLQAENAVDLGFNLLGLFEAFSFIVTVVGGALAVFGVTRVISAQNELTRGRERIEKELAGSTERFEQRLNEKETELEQLRDELKTSAEQQRDRLEKASLAQSLLPLGERQYKAQDYGGALDTYKRALELDPHNLIIHYRLGYVYTQSGNLEAAQYHLKRSLEIEPNFAPSLAGLGYVYRRIGEKMDTGIERDVMLNLAERSILDALKISPRLIDDDGESWWGSLGGLYRRRGQIEQAIYAYQRATEVVPHSSYGLGNLALLYVQTHNREEMLKTYEKVERIAAAEAAADVDNYWGHADLLVAQLALGKGDVARSTLEYTLEIVPDDSPYVLESLLDTLDRLCEALEDDEVPPVKSIITRIREYQTQQAEADAKKRAADSNEMAAVSENESS